MAHEFKRKHSTDIVSGTLLGLVAGVAITIEGWFFAGVIKQILTWETGIWPEWFPGYIPDFFLSKWWFIIVIVICTIGGVVAGYYRHGRLEL